jgi:hypothetical protein
MRTWLYERQYLIAVNLLSLGSVDIISSVQLSDIIYYALVPYNLINSDVSAVILYKVDL